MNEEIKTEMVEAQNRLAQLFEDCLNQFFADDNNADTNPLDFIMKPMYLAAMKRNKGNQSKTAKLLKLSRGTLRKDLEQYFGTTCVGVKYKDSVENIVAKEQELNLRRVI